MKLWDNKTPIALILAAIAIFLGYTTYSQNKAAPTVSLSPSAAPQISTQMVYEGKLPCADCPGIIEELTLMPGSESTVSGTYKQKDTYIDRGSPILEEGSFNVKDNILELIPTKGIAKYYSFGEKLEPLDSNKQKINAPFDQSLTKK